MSFTKDHLEKLSKQQIIEISLKLQSDHHIKLDDLTNKVNSLMATVERLSTKNDKLLSTEKITQIVTDTLSKQLKFFETELHKQQQYSRRECLEIVGFPETIPDNKLEERSIKLFHDIGVNIESREIQACHRLFKKDRVIVKFTQRKDVSSILFNKKKIKDMHGMDKIYINESLCPYYRRLFGKGNALMKDKKIKQIFTRNGTVKIRTLNDIILDVEHSDFFNEHFPNL